MASSSKYGDLAHSYPRTRARFLSDPSICEANRQLFAQFFTWQERKLKRINQLAELDEACIKTMLTYVQRLRNANLWFRNKPWVDLTKEDIRRVYDELEDGVIVTQKGQPFKSRSDYYNKIFKSKPFAMAGKVELANEVIEFYQPNAPEVRFILEAEFRRLVSVVSNEAHQLLFWLAYDLGENITSLLKLERKDCYRERNPNNGDPEYRIHLRAEILKRSRTPRSEFTNYPETVALLDRHLERMTGDLLFPFEYGGAKKAMTRAVAKSGVLCQPKGQKPTWKVLRSGMACDLLKKGWSRDEVNARLGHVPSSRDIDRYISFLALDRHQPKAKAQQFEAKRLAEELKIAQHRQRASEERLRQVEDELRYLQKHFHEIMAVMQTKPALSEVEQAIAMKQGAATPSYIISP